MKRIRHLTSRSLRQHGYHSLVEQIRSSSQRLLAGAGFREYLDPFAGTGYEARLRVATAGSG